MRTLKMFAAVGVVVIMGVGLTGCGAGYTGEGVVISKEVDNRNSSTSKKKSSKIDYELTIDVPESDVNKKFDVSKSKYDSTQVGQTVKIEKGNVK